MTFCCLYFILIFSLPAKSKSDFEDKHISDCITCGIADKDVSRELDFLQDKQFSSPADLKSNSSKALHIGATIRIINKNNDKEESNKLDKGFKDEVERLFTSILKLNTVGTIHWIILTDHNSIEQVSSHLRHLILKHVTMNILMTFKGRKGPRPVPRIIVDYVDIDGLSENTEGLEDFVAALKKWLINGAKGTRKYEDDLFFLAPLYHKIFKNLEKLIFLDID